MITQFTIQHFKAFRNVTANSLGRLNAFVGRNNAGKSTVLHSLDLAGLALRWNDWGRFPLKIKIEDLFWDREDFALSFTTDRGHTVRISAVQRRQPSVDLGGAAKEEFETILILPDPGYTLLNRRAVSPADVFSNMDARNYLNINALDILQAFTFYAEKEQRGLTKKDYENIITQVRTFFPELEEVTSDRTEQLIATLEYKEGGRVLDILYSGMGLKRFLDVLVKVTLSRASIVLLDEPEFGMHPELQRRFLTFLSDLATQNDLQFFLATHSPVFLNAFSDIEVFRVKNTAGDRAIVAVPSELRHTIFGDLGIRPSDLYQNDICLMVEGQTDIVFFEYVLHELYKQEFAGLAIGVVQYAGKAAAGITTGELAVNNVAGVQPYVHWVRDRDARPVDPPNPEAVTFVNAIRAAGQSATLLAKREIEFYIPTEVYIGAQQGDHDLETAARAIVLGDQSQKLRKAFGQAGCKVPRGSTLRTLLRRHLDRARLDPEIKNMVEQILIPWATSLRGG
ncbi:MAG: ATP-dependent endonuclease [Candidatus Binatia bacterium]